MVKQSIVVVSLLLVGCANRSHLPQTPAVIAMENCARPGHVFAYEQFPNYDPGNRYWKIVTDGVNSYLGEHYEYSIYINAHQWDGRYFNYNVTKNFEGNPARVIFDNDGLPKVKYEAVPEANYAGGFEYNPTTLIQFALMEHAKYLAGDKSQLPVLLRAIDKLLSMQNASGGFEYPFPYHHFQNVNTYMPGWTSAIAQGQALSLLARAYSLTGNKAYIEAGDKALAFLLTDTKAGGSRDSLASLSPSLSRYVMFEEYPIVPPDTKSNYTVNGFIHTLIGLHDWSYVKEAGDDATIAGGYFACGLATLKMIVPYADIGGFSAYDLGHVIYKRNPIVNPSYHDTHIYMLYTLHNLTNDPFFKEWADRWAMDVDPELKYYKKYLATK
ncbi:hypothetical protein PTE30175_04225 [Pandoraea terrae]|uniref:D-glucuronyl C5-epimerase C-terminal domain-containing protein n=2 Tax=Pandoraea terrae TaxID=1537710 RepID=A0A5E4Y6U5_9BURK|nr:hypothetical protein PTE30175_04225 [Pandoraea terrae]